LYSNNIFIQYGTDYNDKMELGSNDYEQ